MGFDYRHRQLGVAVAREELARRLLEIWGGLIDAESMVFDTVAEERAYQRQAIELVAAYLKAVPAEEPKPLAVEVSVEAPLVDPATGEDLGIPLVGIMDLVLAEEAGPPLGAPSFAGAVRPLARGRHECHASTGSS